MGTFWCKMNLMNQKEALDILKMGHSAFITGAAGSGKTHLLNQYIGYLRDNGAHSVLGITASTGIAATHMGGQTIHSWSGLGIRASLSERDLDDLEEKQYLWKRIEKARVLIIDEISMLHHFRLDLVERIVRSFKRNSLPFGGIQVILCGDFFQLPPVARAEEEPAKFAYHSETWETLGFKICYLEEQHRQNDLAFLEVLNAVRDNRVTKAIIERLETRFNKKSEGTIEPTKLYSHNINVDLENDKELGKIEAGEYRYQMTESGIPALAAVLKKTCLAPETLRLRKGARVMFVKNNFEMGYANGTLGVVSECSSATIVVKTARGEIIAVERASWRVEEGGKVLAEINQYPLRLAWAITVHKSQGMSLDAAEVDLSQAFEKGMGYVALSRVRTLAGLSLKGLNNKALEVHPEVLEYDANFREISKEDAEALRAINSRDVEKFQKEFLSRIVPAGDKAKKEKPPTTDLTKVLLAEEKSLKEIAEARGLKVETILSHIEKILHKDPKFPVSYLKKELPAGKFKKISAAFAKVATTRAEPLLSGVLPPLSPVKSLLGSSFSFEEIRLVRLFL